MAEVLIAKLTPSGHTTASYATFTDETNMYTDTDSDTFAIVGCTYSGSMNITWNLNGFNFGLIPSGVPITRFEVKLKASVTGLTGSGYNQTHFQFMSGQGANGITKVQGVESTPTVKTYENTISGNGNILTWDTVVSYANSTTLPNIYFYMSMGTGTQLKVYGAEIDVYGWAPDTHGIFNLILPRG